MTKYSLKHPGIFPDEVDERDAISSNFIADTKLPASFMLEDPGTPIKSQNGFPSCGGQAGAGIKEYMESKEAGKPVEISGRAIFAKAKEIDGYPNLQGTFTRVIMEVLRKHGAVKEEQYPEKHGIPYDEYIKPVPLSEALRNKGDVRIKITSNNYEDIKQFIYNTKTPATLAVRGSNKFWNADAVKKNGYYVKSDGNNQWGHLVFVVGWLRDGSLVIRNSWHKNWGKNGYAYLPMAYNGLMDCWGAFDLPNDWKEKNKKGITYTVDQATEIVNIFYSALIQHGHPQPTAEEKQQHIKSICAGITLIDVWTGFAVWMKANLGQKGYTVALNLMIDIRDSLNILIDTFKKKYNK